MSAVHYPMYLWEENNEKNYFIMLDKPAYNTREEALSMVIADGFEMMATSENVSACTNDTLRFPIVSRDEVAEAMGVRLVVGEINGRPVYFCAGVLWEGDSDERQDN